MMFFDTTTAFESEGSYEDPGYPIIGHPVVRGRSPVKRADAALGLDKRRVQLKPYDARWPRLYCREAQRLRRVLGPDVTAVAHIGSTAIPGMPAKPIIDIMATVAPDASYARLEETLEWLGYAGGDPAGVPERRFYTRGNDGLKTHHLSLVPEGADYWRVQLLFRDYLRRHPKTANAYADLKGDLMRQFWQSRPDYTEGKSDFVAAILELARRRQ